MTVGELKEAGKALYGYGWQTALASSLGVDGSTVRRWIGSGVGVPAPASAAIRGMAANARMRAALLALHLPANGAGTAFRVDHRTLLEKVAFSTAARARGYRMLDDGSRSMTSIAHPDGGSDDAQAAVATLNVDEDGTVHLS